LGRSVSNVTQAKRGFTVALGEWLRGPLRPLLEEELLGRTSLAGLALDASAVRGRVEHHLAGGDETYKLWKLLNLSLWERRYRSAA